MPKPEQDTPSGHDPGTPDDDVSPMRLEGRRARRERDMTSEPSPGESGRVDWWLGWYDERLRRFYGR